MPSAERCESQEIFISDLGLPCTGDVLEPSRGDLLGGGTKVRFEAGLSPSAKLHAPSNVPS
jgi:hypothetical protein